MGTPKKCKTHVCYTGKSQPRRPCEACWLLWDEGPVMEYGDLKVGMEVEAFHSGRQLWLSSVIVQLDEEHICHPAIVQALDYPKHKSCCSPHELRPKPVGKALEAGG